MFLFGNILNFNKGFGFILESFEIFFSFGGGFLFWLWLFGFPISLFPFGVGRWLCLVFLFILEVLVCENFGKSEIWVELGCG